MGRFYCLTEKNRCRAVFFKKTNFKLPAKFKFSRVPVTRTSFDKRLNDKIFLQEMGGKSFLREN
jgi:hypothetical protein